MELSIGHEMSGIPFKDVDAFESRFHERLLQCRSTHDGCRAGAHNTRLSTGAVSFRHPDVVAGATGSCLKNDIRASQKDPTPSMFKKPRAWLSDQREKKTTTLHRLFKKKLQLSLHSYQPSAARMIARYG